MRRYEWLIGFGILLVIVGISDYASYRNLKIMGGELRSLHRDVNDATKMAQEESAAVAAASRSAEESAARATVAAEGRKQAESAKQQAESAKQQAESAKQQAEAAAQQASAASEAAQEKMSQMQREREEELNRMQEALNRVAETKRTANGMIISLPNSIFRFDFDKADLNQHARELLSRIAGILLVSKGYGLSVFGYTDDVGSAEYNRDLSLRRAKAVEDYLIHAGIDPAIINVKGYGKSSPLIDSSTADARSRNRRVEIALTDSSVHF